ncbi:MAG: DUF4249 domain-containing protein [Bacteroidota bacterium]
MRKIIKLSILSFLAISLFHCEDPIDLESRFEGPQLVVDAWITNAPDTQRITLTESQDFYANRLPTPVTDAQVAVCPTADLTACYIFEHTTNGVYEWIPAPGDSLGPIGTEYGLGIQRGDQQYTAVTTLNRTAQIDSISFQFEEEALGLDEGLYAQIYARDPLGTGDAYWIRSTINDTLLLRPFEINVAYDAVFDPGTDADGIAFIFPIRFGINRLDDDGSPIPLEPGDKVEVDIWSISDEAYLFLNIAGEQIANGESGIFALPVANSPGNVFNFDTGEPVLGIFNVAASARVERTVEE